MAGKMKLKRFAEITSFSNVLEAFTFDDGYLHSGLEEKILLKGRWNSQFFGVDYPLCLELACGKGEYTLGLAALYPDWNFVGLDIKGSRIWKGASQAIHNNMQNVGFLRSRIEFIDYYFDECEVSEIWIVFPDPFLKVRDENRRLTSPFFLDKYQHMLSNGSLVHLKTDSDELYDYSIESIASHPNFQVEIKCEDIDQSPRSKALAITTYYEKLHIENGKKIKYIQARLQK